MSEIPPNHPVPAGVDDVSEWCDVDTFEDTWRVFTSPRRGVGQDWAYAYGMQNRDGTVEQLCVRAQLDITGRNLHHDWETMLTVQQAIELADRLDSSARLFAALANGVRTAAADLDGWQRGGESA